MTDLDETDLPNAVVDQFAKDSGVGQFMKVK